MKLPCYVHPIDGACSERIASVTLVRPGLPRQGRIHPVGRLTPRGGMR
jgi:hypothetical protein